MVLLGSAALAACDSESAGGGGSTGSTSQASTSASTSASSGSGGDSAESSTTATTSGSTGTGGCDVEADCDDEDACTDDGCSEGVCSHFPVDFDDDDACTDDACDPGTGEVTNTPVDVDDGDACTADLCDPRTGEITHEGDGCNDGDVCTTDACVDGATCTNTADQCSATHAGVQPIFVAKCGPCHEGDTPTGCAGGTCLASFYEATQLTLVGGACDGQTAFDCILQTIADGSMPRGVTCTGDTALDAETPGCIQVAERAAIEQWVGAGAPP